MKDSIKAIIGGTIAVALAAAGAVVVRPDEPAPEIPVTEEIRLLEEEMSAREARGESTTIQLQKINELKQRAGE